jgi:hypothetical protein
MKKTCLQLMLAISFITVVSCKNKPSDNPPVKKAVGEYFGFTQVRYRYDSAQIDIKRYQDEHRLRYNKEPIYAYTIHAEDLLTALGWPAVHHDSAVYKYARAYIGLNSNYEFKLYIVPVINANLDGHDKSKWVGGTDVILDSLGHAILPGRLRDENDEYMLNLNAPCPNTCATPPPPNSKKS